MKLLNAKYYKFIIYLIVVVMLNLVAMTVFFRIDLTKDKLYSLSGVSKEVVKTLSEPLTVHVFFTKNLPAPHNNTERYLHDLLNEYAIYGGKYFNYQFHDVDVEEGGETEATKKNQEMANNYGVYPVQIQNIEQDEVKFQKAYMGMVLLHGNMIERIPAITSTEGLEYKITMAIKKMNNKISALLRLKDKIQVKLFLSSSLEIVAPYINITGLSEIPAKMETVVKNLNEKNYGKFEFHSYNPTLDAKAAAEEKKYKLFHLKWEQQADRLGKEIPAGEGTAGIVIEYAGKTAEIPLIQAIQIPLFGTKYDLVEMDKIPGIIEEAMEGLIEINEDIGYLADFGTLPLYEQQNPIEPQQQSQEDSINNFYTIVSSNYSIKQINLEKEDIPPNVNTLIIAGAKDQLSDYALFQIDQFLMQGKSLALFYDAFKEVRQDMYYQQQQGPMYLPLNTGLEKLLKHYGVSVRKSYVLDENCYKQRMNAAFGGGEQPIYFAPIIKKQNISKKYGFIKNIEQLIMIQASPVEVDETRLKEFGITAEKLFASSEQSWEMSDRINLNPYFIEKPDKLGEKSYALAYLLQGEFPSYFAGKSVPEKPALQEEKPEQAETSVDMTKIKPSGTVIEKGKPGKIFITGASEILKNNVLDREGNSPNALLVMNVLDYLNGRENIAVMRSKQQRFNLLDETKPGTKTFAKTFNIAGLPVLVVLAGIVVWFLRKRRKAKIRTMFNK